MTNDDMTAVVTRMNVRRTSRDRISADERAFDQLLSMIHERAFRDGWDACKRFTKESVGHPNLHTRR